MVLILLLAAWLSSPKGKRLAVLFAVIAYPVLVTALLHYINYRWPSAGYWGYEGLPTLPTVLEVLVVGAPAAIIYRARRQRPVVQQRIGRGPGLTRLDPLYVTAGQFGSPAGRHEGARQKGPPGRHES